MTTLRFTTLMLAIVAISLGAYVLLADDPQTVVYSSPTHSVVVTRNDAGGLSVGIDNDQVYQDGTYVGVSQNGKYVIRVRIIELRKGLEAEERAGNDKGFADPVKIQTDYTKAVFSGSTEADGLPVFIRIMADERGNFLLITTTSVPVQTDKEVHPTTTTL